MEKTEFIEKAKISFIITKIISFDQELKKPYISDSYTCRQKYKQLYNMNNHIFELQPVRYEKNLFWKKYAKNDKMAAERYWECQLPFFLKLKNVDYSCAEDYTELSIQVLLYNHCLTAVINHQVDNDGITIGQLADITDNCLSQKVYNISYKKLDGTWDEYKKISLNMLAKTLFNYIESEYLNEINVNDHFSDEMTVVSIKKANSKLSDLTDEDYKKYLEKLFELIRNTPYKLILTKHRKETELKRGINTVVQSKFLQFIFLEQTIGIRDSSGNVKYKNASTCYHVNQTMMLVHIMSLGELVNYILDDNELSHFYFDKQQEQNVREYLRNTNKLLSHLYIGKHNYHSNAAKNFITKRYSEQLKLLQLKLNTEQWID